MAEEGSHPDSPTTSKRSRRRQQMLLVAELCTSSSASAQAFTIPPQIPQVLGLCTEHSTRQYQRMTECFAGVLALNESRLEHPRQRGFADHLLEEKSEHDFFRNVRVTKQTFADLVTILDRAHQTRYPGGFPPLSNEECVLVSLWYLGNKATFREIGELFGYSEGCTFQAVERFLNIICAEADTYISWPTHDEATAIEQEFKSVAGFPGVLGAIDGSHIEIKAPTVVQADYLDRNNRHSITLLAVCDRKKTFTFIDAGFPGSAHDSRVYRCSTLGRTLVTQPRQLLPSPSHHIIGDSGFQLSPHLLTPYKDFGTLTHTQRKYNNKLSQTRVVIENAFGWLKGRFRRLKYIDAEVEKAKKIVTACCVLHNITLANPLEEEYLADEVHEFEDFDNVYAAVNLPEVEGREKRDFIASLL